MPKSDENSSKVKKFRCLDVLKSNINGNWMGAALILLALTQIPIAIKNAAEVACIGELSNQLWKQANSHKGVNTIAVQRCNGGINTILDN